MPLIGNSGLSVPSSPREIREANDREALIEAFRAGDYGHLLDEHEPEVIDASSVRVGPYIIRPGASADKPVIVDATTKRMVKGSGRLPKGNDPVLTGKATAYKQTKEYRQAFEEMFPAGGDVDERGSLAWWFDQAWAAAEGSPQYVECPHTECKQKHVVAMKKDGGLIFKMIELAVGRAPQTVNVNSKHEEIVKALEYRVYDVTLHGIGADEADERHQLIQQFGYTLDGGFVEAESPLSLPSGEESAVPSA